MLDRWSASWATSSRIRRSQGTPDRVGLDQDLTLRRVIGRAADVLAWNPMGHALLASHVSFDAPADPRPPNVARMLFLDPHTHELYRDWRSKAADTVAGLHQMSARYPDDSALARVIGELTMASTEFAALWRRRPVRTCSFYLREFRHPIAREFTLADETLALPDDRGAQLGLFYAAAGTSDPTWCRP